MCQNWCPNCSAGLCSPVTAKLVHEQILVFHQNMGDGMLASEPRFWKWPLSCGHSGVCIRVFLRDKIHKKGMILHDRVFLVSVILRVECTTLLNSAEKVVSENNDTWCEDRDRGVICIICIKHAYLISRYVSGAVSPFAPVCFPYGVNPGRTPWRAST